MRQCAYAPMCLCAFALYAFVPICLSAYVPMQLCVQLYMVNILNLPDYLLLISTLIGIPMADYFPQQLFDRNYFICGEF